MTVGARIYFIDMSRISLHLFVIFGSLAFGQLDSNSVTVTATRNLTAQPDQAVFSLSVTSDLKTTLSDVLTALQPAGVTIANFSGVNTLNVYLDNQPQISVVWAFNLVAPLTKTSDTVATLSALESSVPKANPKLTLSFAIQGTQVSSQLQQSQTCSTADLISDARTQAQTLATAGGRTLSGILALSGSTQASGYPACSLTVKFALLGS
jgi:hypothetical protein